METDETDVLQTFLVIVDVRSAADAKGMSDDAM